MCCSRAEKGILAVPNTSRLALGCISAEISPLRCQKCSLANSKCGFWSSQDIITIPASPRPIFNSVLSQLFCPCPRTWPRSWLRVRRELSSSSSQTHLAYGGWLQALSELVQQCRSWRLSSQRRDDPTESSTLRFAAAETVCSDPAGDKHQPGLIFWAVCKLQCKQDPWHGSRAEGRMSSMEILMRWQIWEEKKLNTWVT